MSKTAVKSPNAPAAIGPYSQAIFAGNTLYVSGQLGIDPATGAFAEGCVKEQTRRSLENITAILAEMNLDLTSVVKTTVFLKDMNDFAAMNEVYAGFFAEPYPARVCVQVAQLPKNGLVEIDATCVVEK